MITVGQLRDRLNFALDRGLLTENHILMGAQFPDPRAPVFIDNMALPALVLDPARYANPDDLSVYESCIHIVFVSPDQILPDLRPATAGNAPSDHSSNGEDYDHSSRRDL